LGQYALKECSDCHVVAPANEMFSKTGEAVTGRSVSSSNYKATLGPSYSAKKDTNTTHYRSINYWLCFSCERDRRKRVRKAILLAAFISIVLIVFALVSASIAPKRNLPAATFSSNSDPDFGAVSDNAGSGNIATAPLPEAESQEPTPSDPVKNAENQDAKMFLSQLPAMLESRIQDALLVGHTELWRMNDEQIDIKPSCRNVIVTLITKNDQKKSEAHQWCRPDGQESWTMKE
jgi:hypothetical protein